MKVGPADGSKDGENNGEGEGKDSKIEGAKEGMRVDVSKGLIDGDLESREEGWVVGTDMYEVWEGEIEIHGEGRIVG